MNMKNYIYIILCALSVVFVSCSDNDENQKTESSLYTKEGNEYIDHLGEYSTKDMKLPDHESPLYYPNLLKFFQELAPLIKVLFIIVIAVILVMIALHFYRNINSNNKNKVVKGSGAEESLDTIYGHDWSNEIDQAKTNGEWGKAIMLVYLYCLYNLDSHNLIAWKDSKTPTEYYYELKTDKYRKPLYNLTMLYLRARYADIVADEDMFNSALQEQKRIGNEN